MRSPWRLLDTGPRPIAENMALDKVILTALNQGKVPPTVRFLEFSPPCVTVGFHQSVELEIEEDYCREHGIQINRRLTGGGNLYLDEGNLGWEIFAPRDTPGIPRHLDDMYRLMCESAVAGLARLGVAASFRPKNDVEVDGRKISGSGGMEMGNCFVYHGTMLVDFDVDSMIRCLKLPVKKLEDKQVETFKERVITLREILGCAPPMEAVKKAMAEGFAAVLGLELCPGRLTEAEEALLGQELPVFQSESWIYGDRRLQQSNLSVFDYKAQGGLIRVSALVDRQRQILKYVFISGDFFAYPERSILDLEAALKNTSCRFEDIALGVDSFFARHQVRIPGVLPEDFTRAICGAVASA